MTLLCRIFRAFLAFCFCFRSSCSDEHFYQLFLYLSKLMLFPISVEIAALVLLYHQFNGFVILHLELGKGFNYINLAQSQIFPPVRLQRTFFFICLLKLLYRACCKFQNQQSKRQNLRLDNIVSLQTCMYNLLVNCQALKYSICIRFNSMVNRTFCYKSVGVCHILDQCIKVV